MMKDFRKLSSTHYRVNLHEESDYLRELTAQCMLPLKVKGEKMDQLFDCLFYSYNLPPDNICWWVYSKHWVLFPFLQVFSLVKCKKAKISTHIRKLRCSVMRYGISVSFFRRGTALVPVATRGVQKVPGIFYLKWRRRPVSSMSE